MNLIHHIRCGLGKNQMHYPLALSFIPYAMYYYT